MPDMIRLAIGAMLRLTDLLTMPGLHFLSPSAGPIAASPSVSMMPPPRAIPGWEQTPLVHSATELCSARRPQGSGRGNSHAQATEDKWGNTIRGNYYFAPI
jgi:hypothetical protein